MKETDIKKIKVPESYTEYLLLSEEEKMALRRDMKRQTKKKPPTGHGRGE